MFYERIIPVVGTTLREKVIGIINPELSMRVIEFLASCGVTRFNILADEAEINALKIYLKKHNPLENYEIEEFTNNNVDLLIVINKISPDLSNEARGLSPLLKSELKPIYLFAGFTDDGFYISLKEPEVSVSPSFEYFNWLDLSNQVAHYAVALLLEGTFWQQKEIVNFIKERQIIYFSNKKWPWFPYSDTTLPNPLLQREGEKNQFSTGNTISTSQSSVTSHSSLSKTILIVGCGSLGSVFTGCISPFVSKLILADHDQVSIYNPVRQEFHFSQVGKNKVIALRENLEAIYSKKHLGIKCINKNFNQKNIKEFGYLLKKIKPDLVVLATGSHDEYELAEVLWNKKINHISMRCYPRAKWFEIIIVLPGITPCFGCFRGNLYTGPIPTLTPEQQARYNPDYKPGELEAEPATKTDSARCAEVASRLAYQILTTEKENWYSSLIENNHTCLIGGNRVEKENENYCYGIALPGQVSAFGINEINSSLEECLFCKRKFAYGMVENERR